MVVQLSKETRGKVFQIWHPKQNTVNIFAPVSRLATFPIQFILMYFGSNLALIDVDIHCIDPTSFFCPSVALPQPIGVKLPSDQPQKKGGSNVNVLIADDGCLMICVHGPFGIPAATKTRTQLAVSGRTYYRHTGPWEQCLSCWNWVSGYLAKRVVRWTKCTG